jgi:gliding motility-associated protein GldM
MALPREPRQKMINMMYLVLTALLALNVSSEILNAFKTVNNSLEETNRLVNITTQDIMASLQAKTTDDKTKTRAVIWYPHAQKAQQLTQGLNTYIQNLKDQILLEAGADYAKQDSSYKDDNLDIATRIMVEKGAGKELLGKLTKFRTDMLAIDPEIAKEFTNSLPINLNKPKTKGNKSWEDAYFRMVPTVAALTILSKFQNDVKTSENKVVNFCHEKVGKVEIVFDRYKPLVGQNATVLLAGQKLQVRAGLAAFNNDKRPTISIGGAVVPLDNEGLAVKEFPVNSSGKIPVRIEYTDQNGQTKIINEEVEYTVGQSSAAVQLDNMNVLFIGVDNPVTISGSGSVQDITASISGGGGSLIGSGSKRTVRVSQITDNCVISVKTPDGKVTNVPFRVRSIPDPTPMIGTYKSGNIPASYFKSQAGVRAILENFYYKTQFNVTTFRITGDGAGFDDIIEANNTGAEWREASTIINRCRPGSFVTIEDIYAIGPDGTRRKLPPLIYYLK